MCLFKEQYCMQKFLFAVFIIRVDKELIKLNYIHPSISLSEIVDGKGLVIVAGKISIVTT